MVVVQLLYNGYPAMLLEAKTPRALRGILLQARAGHYDINIVRGQEYAWVQTILDQQLEAAE